MAGVGRRGLWLRVTVAFMLVLSAWVSSLMCLSLHGLAKNLQHTGVDEAVVAGRRRGTILFDGKDLELQVEPSSAAASGKLLKIILGHSTLSEDSTNKEAAWKHLKPSLHCGQSQMAFRATGHSAADIQLDIGAADSLPLNQVPKSCGYTVRKSALGFVLAVSYDGCNMIRENGNYVLKMRWLNASVEFICSMSSSKLPHLYASQLSQEPEPLPVRNWRPNRHRRATPGQIYDPHSYYYACLRHYYNMMNAMHASNTQTATLASPPRDDRQIPLYFPYYNPYYYQVGNTPVMAPQSSACALTTGTQQKPQCSHHPPGHTKLPFYHSSGPIQQGFPGSPLPHQVFQQYHGKYPYHPLPQTALDVPGKPRGPTKHPHKPSTTTAPVTVRTTRCPNQERPIGASCLGAVSTYVPYKNLTFRPHISYKAGMPAEDEEKNLQPSLDHTGVAHPRAFSPLGSYKPVYMPSYFLENPVVEIPWFSYYLPHVYQSLR